MTDQIHTDKSLPHVVVVGGGFGGIELIKKLRKTPLRVTLLDKHNYHTFQPLLYQVASGGLGSDSIGYPFRLIFRNQKNFRFRLANVFSVDAENRRLETDIGPVDYDYLVLGTGSTSNYFGNRKIEQWSMPLKSIPEALNLRSDLLQEFEKALTQKDPSVIEQHLTFIIVGGGPTGVETAGALAEFKRFVMPHDYPELDPEMMKVFLIEAGPRLLAGMSEKSSAKALEYLRNMGVLVELSTSVKSFDGAVAELSNGKLLNSFTLIWSAGVKGVILDGLPAESVAANRYQVDEFNRVKGVSNIFAIGDAAGMFGENLPKGHPMVAPVAVQQGRLLARNLQYLLKGRDLKPFKYNDKGSMATVGRNRAVVDLPFMRFGGILAWFVWMFLHLMLLVGFRNRLVVFIDWLWNYISYERALRLIIRKFEFPDTGEIEEISGSN